MNRQITAHKAFFFLALVLLLFGVGASVQAWWWKSDDAAEIGDATELQWDDLIPEGFMPAPSPIANMTQEQIDKLFDGSEESNRELAEIEEMMLYAPTVADLDGQLVKLPGYIVPLDFDGQTRLSEFLLVPYYGACIHTPPPPANQVVHANAKETITVDNTYDPVWAFGTMRTETVVSNLAEAGYQLDILAIRPYDVSEAAADN